MTFRIFTKSLRLAIRTGKRFLFFVGIYAILMAWTAYTLDGLMTGGNILPVLLLLIAVAVVSLVYGLLISSYRKVQVATLRCLGWTSADIKWLFIGELVLVCLISALIDLEVLIHVYGISGFFGSIPASIFGATPFLISFGVILLMQLIGVLIAWNRMLKIKPMEALRKA
jgi:ABC-type lipoprotein release transport system permease subunit